MKEKHELIKRLLLEAKTLEEIRIEAQTSWGTIYKVIEANGLQEFRKKVSSAYKSKNAKRLQTKEVILKRSQSKTANEPNRREARLTGGNQVKNQARLDEKVKELGYKSCFDYISQHGAMSFRNNILI